VNFATARPELQKFAIVYSDNALATAAAAAAEQQAKKNGRRVVVKQLFTSSNFDARRMVEELKSKGVDALFFFGMGKEQALLLSEAAATEWSPRLFLLGAFSGKELPA